jgi:hypothetical protein
VNAVTLRRILVVAGESSQLDHIRWEGSLGKIPFGPEVVIATPRPCEPWGIAANVRRITYRYEERSHAAGARDRETGTVRRFFDRPGFRWRFLEKILRGLEVPVRWWTPRGLMRVIIESPHLVARSVRFLPIVVRAMPGVHRQWRRRMLRTVVAGCGIDAVIRAENPDAVVVLFKQQDGYTLATQAACQVASIPCVVVPLKWDNATSKTVFRIVPDRLAVFSEAIGRAAAWVHGFDQHHCREVGSAQTDAQLRLIGTTVVTPHFGQVLALGFGNPRSESRSWLPALSRLASEWRATGRQMLVHWRPYPAASEDARAMLVKKAHELGVVLDEDIAGGNSHRADSRSASERAEAFGRYVDLLRRSDLVVAGPTSAVLDARMAGLPVVIPAFREGALLCDAPHLLRVFTHSQGLRETNGVFIAETEEDFVRLVNDFLDRPRRIPPDNSGEHIFVDERSYAQRLIDVIEDAVAARDRERAASAAGQTSGQG